MIYISLGSNLGNRRDHLHRAVDLLKERYLKNVRCSIILETKCLLPLEAPEDWNKPFLNMVVAGDSSLSPELLLEGLKKIEQDLGRPKIHERWSPRIIDLDILFWEEVIRDTPSLKIPHPELKNRSFFIHLLAMMDISFKKEDLSQPCFLKSFTLSPQLVGIVNITKDSFSDGGLYHTPDKAIQQALKLSEEGATIIEIGAQSTKPGVLFQDEKDEYARLIPVLDGLKPFLEQKTIVLSVDTFRPTLISKIIKNYPIAWINDVAGDLDKETLHLIRDQNCSLCVMHALGIPPTKERILPQNQSPLNPLLEWAKRKTDHLLSLGFKKEKIIIDPGIGYGKSSPQNLEILRHLDVLKRLGFPLLVGHSRKRYIESFSREEAKNRDIETLAVSGFIADHVDFLRVHNVKDHMRFLTAQQVLKGDLL